MRKAMVDKNHPQLSIRQQCLLLDVNRNRLKPKTPKIWQPSPEQIEMIELMKVIHQKDPTMGTRQLRYVLGRHGYRVTRWSVGRMMRHLGLRAIYRKPRTTIPTAEHPKYPYLLRNKESFEVDEVWATDITYIPWRKGWVYLCAIIDWKTRAVLSWKLSNTMDVDFCLSMLSEAVAIAETVPKILNTDQGSQFTSVDWISAVESLGVKVSMDGKGSWQDNILIERFWRSVKHEWVLLHAYETLPELERLIAEWMERYNYWRPHRANDGETPWQSYRGVAPVLENTCQVGDASCDRGSLSASASIPPLSQRKAA